MNESCIPTPHIVIFKTYGGLWTLTEYPSEGNAIEAYEKLIRKYDVAILAKRVRKHVEG